MRSWFIVGGTLAACLLAVVVAVQVASPPAPPEPRARAARRAKAPDRSAIRERRDEQRAARRERKEAREERRQELLERREARAEQRKAERPSPEEKALIRADARGAQLDDVIILHDDVCADLGIEPDLADEVAVLLMDTAELVGSQLERVDRGEVEWDEVKDDVRALRLAQAEQVEAMLGPDLFFEWAMAMGFERLTRGDEEADAPP